MRVDAVGMAMTLGATQKSRPQAWAVGADTGVEAVGRGCGHQNHGREPGPWVQTPGLRPWAVGVDAEITVASLGRGCGHWGRGRGPWVWTPGSSVALGVDGGFVAVILGVDPSLWPWA